MTVKELAETMELTVLTGGKGLENEVKGCYCCDLFNRVIAKARKGDLWLTVTGDINSVAVAILTNCACIILTELAALDTDARLKAENHGIAVLTTNKTTYETAAEISSLLNK